MQRSVQHRARSPQPPTSPYAGAEAYTLAYSGAPPSQILAGAPPPLPPPVRNPTGPTSARENALEARELALEERLRYVEAMLAAKTRMEGSVSRGAASRGVELGPPGQVWRRQASTSNLRARGRPRAEFKGELLAFLLGRWAARTRRPRTQRQPLWNARERLRLVGRFVPTKRAHRHPPSPAAVFAREWAPPRTTRRAEASLLFLREE